MPKFFSYRNDASCPGEEERKFDVCNRTARLQPPLRRLFLVSIRIVKASIFVIVAVEIAAEKKLTGDNLI